MPRLAGRLDPDSDRRKFQLDPTFYGIRTLLTIHNLGYQGLFRPESLAELGLPEDLFDPAAMEFWGNISFLKGGIVFSDAINTVSRGYAKEIQTEEYGFGLDGLLRARADVLTGIVNGVDYEEWSPERDNSIAAHYDLDNLEGKLACKRELLSIFGLPLDRLNVPVIGIVSRFATQKGFDLIEEIAADLVEEDIFLTAIGSGEPRYEEMFRTLAETHPGKIGVRVTYNDELAHKIEAGADMFLMPSRYEPCGLIRSTVCGTGPSRLCGPRADWMIPSTMRNGFKFQEYSGPALLKAIRTALRFTKTATVAKVDAECNAGDFSWNASAAEYSELYRRITG